MKFPQTKTFIKNNINKITKYIWQKGSETINIHISLMIVAHQEKQFEK